MSIMPTLVLSFSSLAAPVASLPSSSANANECPFQKKGKLVPGGGFDLNSSIIISDLDRPAHSNPTSFLSSIENFRADIGCISRVKKLGVGRPPPPFYRSFRPSLKVLYIKATTHTSLGVYTPRHFINNDGSAESSLFQGPHCTLFTASGVHIFTVTSSLKGCFFKLSRCQEVGIVTSV
ncbi:hypothetical protein GGS20DRAFT_533023 [Poronia punctata]|nr:hypothetical protein GGS20DRAFT_533023 [Poronia punctata]